MEINRYVSLSNKLDISDIDWEAAAKAGLTEREKFIIQYFSDIEKQTVMYMRDLLHTRAIDDPDVLSFLTIWNYEEFYHGHALAKLMEVCGAPINHDIADVRSKITWRERLNDWASGMVSRLFPTSFFPLYLAWGSTQEATTYNGYVCLSKNTQNPVLKTICQRIMKQEQVHFAWYYNNAKRHLAGSKRARRFTRFMLKHFWTPVGAGTKPDEDVVRMFYYLFPGDQTKTLIEFVDSRINDLPGLEDINLMQHFIDNLAKKTQFDELKTADYSFPATS